MPSHKPIVGCAHGVQSTGLRPVATLVQLCNRLMCEVMWCHLFCADVQPGYSATIQCESILCSEERFRASSLALSFDNSASFLSTVRCTWGVKFLLQNSLTATRSPTTKYLLSSVSFIAAMTAISSCNETSKQHVTCKC